MLIVTNFVIATNFLSDSGGIVTAPGLQHEG
jgi:hypothetical protein